MSFYELFQQSKFKEVYCEAEEFTKKKLEKYNQKISGIAHNRRTKEIFDAVWGNIEFSAGEMYILDSPLLQRLRKIKQLGLAHFVYCGSDYSRFYHTTGVVYLADRMSASLNRSDIGTEKQKEYFKSVVRLAAIFHDTGHMFFSHASEHYFGGSPKYFRHDMITDMLEEFERKTLKDVALHELLSCMIVNTTEVRKLIRCVANELKGISIENDNDLDKLIDYISGLIVGVPVDRAILPYSTIINGAIDADKCDYLSRDSHVTKVPVAVDISRLTQKLSVVETAEINKSEMWNRASSSDGPYYELAMSDSAEKALFQLCIARTIMFDSVYYHHKVLTAETELRSLINELANLEEPIFRSFTEILEYVDEDFNRHFFELLKSKRKGKDVERINSFSAKWEQLCMRDMAKRIACIMPEYMECSQSARERLFDDVLTSLNSSKEDTLITQIQKQYGDICGLLGIKNDDDFREENVFIIQAPNVLYGHSKINVPIALNDGNKRKFKGYELVSSRETSSSASYVVSNVEFGELMYFALEKVLYDQYRIILSKGCGACGKYDEDKMKEYHLKLFEKGFYDAAPGLIWDFILESYLSDAQMENLKDRFSGYEGPDGYRIGIKQIRGFFTQIICACNKKEDCNQLVKGIIKLLESSIFASRKYIADNIKSLLQHIKNDGEELLVIPLGGSRDSAEHITYYFNDIKLGDTKINTELTLHEALNSEKVNTIIFFDDGSYSGYQMVSIMQEYMGVPDKERKTKENHVKVLDEQLRERLKGITVVFMFLMFNSDKEEEIKTDLSKLGISKVQFLYSNDMKQLGMRNAGLFADNKQRDIVKKFLGDVGYQLIKRAKTINGTYKEGWNDKRAHDASLGYNDAQQMFFLKSSVPTYTITAFWQDGVYNDIEWKPLFKRTIKD